MLRGNFRIAKEFIRSSTSLSPPPPSLLSGSSEVEQWAFFSETMAALVAMLHEYSSFMRVSWGPGRKGEEEAGEVGLSLL
jgi:hypothetical protein